MRGGLLLAALVAALAVLVLPLPDMAGTRRRPLFLAIPEFLHRADLMCDYCQRPCAAEDLFLYATRGPVWPYVCLSCDRAMAGQLLEKG